MRIAARRRCKNPEAALTGPGMSLSTWWVFVSLNLVLDLTPGPAVLYVLSSALRGNAGRGIAASCGILTANALYFALSATGIGVVILASYRLFFAIKWLGAAYLVYLGARALLARDTGFASAGGAAPSTPASDVYRGGVFVQLSNPKAIVYFSAIVPQFVNAREPVLFQVALLGITAIVCEFAVLSLYSVVAGKAAALARTPAFARWTNRGAGLLLIGAGAGLAALRRD